MHHWIKSYCVTINIWINLMHCFQAFSFVCISFHLLVLTRLDKSAHQSSRGFEDDITCPTMNEYMKSFYLVKIWFKIHFPLKLFARKLKSLIKVQKLYCRFYFTPKLLSLSTINDSDQFRIKSIRLDYKTQFSY